MNYQTIIAIISVILILLWMAFKEWRKAQVGKEGKEILKFSNKEMEGLYYDKETV